jgi:hypothetical protein
MDLNHIYTYIDYDRARGGNYCWRCSGCWSRARVGCSTSKVDLLRQRLEALTTLKSPSSETSYYPKLAILLTSSKNGHGWGARVIVEPKMT